MIILVVVLAASVPGGYYFWRRRKRPISTAEVAPHEVKGDFPNDESRMTPSPYPSTIPLANPSPDPSSTYKYTRDMKSPMVEAPGHEIREPAELQSPDPNQSDFIQFINKPTEIYTKISDDPSENYESAARRMEFQRKFATASEMDASPTVFELPGNNPLAEMDDERSRLTLSPRLARSPLSRQSSFQNRHISLSQHSSYQNKSPSLSPAISAQSPSPRVSSGQGRISPFAGLTRQSSNSPNTREMKPPNLEPPHEHFNLPRRSGTSNSANSGISGNSEESTGTPLSMTSPTLGRPPSMFMRTFSKSGKPVWNRDVTPGVPSRGSSNATTLGERKNPNNSWFF